MRELVAILADLEQGDLLSLWDLFDWLDAKVRRSGPGSLTQPGRVIFLVQLYDGGMSRGGFHSLMRWDPGLGVMQMIPALQEVGAYRTAAVLTDLASLFPAGTIPDNARLRCREFEDQVMPREQEMEQVHAALRAAESSENVTTHCLEFARRNAVVLLTEEAEPLNGLGSQ